MKFQNALYNIYNMDMKDFYDKCSNTRTFSVNRDAFDE